MNSAGALQDHSRALIRGCVITWLQSCRNSEWQSRAGSNLIIAQENTDAGSDDRE